MTPQNIRVISVIKQIYAYPLGKLLISLEELFYY
jgi:hypothetical protein